MKIYGDLNLSEGSEVGNLTVPVGTAFPAETTTGELFFRTDNTTLYVYNGTAWEAAQVLVGIDDTATSAQLVITDTNTDFSGTITANESVHLKQSADNTTNGLKFERAGASTAHGVLYIGSDEGIRLWSSWGSKTVQTWTRDGDTTIDGDITVSGGQVYLTTLAGKDDTNTSIRFDGSDVMTLSTGNTAAITLDGSQISTFGSDINVPDGTVKISATEGIKATTGNAGFKIHPIGTLADEASTTITTGSNVGMMILNINIGSTSGSIGISLYTGAAPTVMFGDGADAVRTGTTNPNIDGKLNIYSSDGSSVTILNRLGLSKTVAAFTFGY